MALFNLARQVLNFGAQQGKIDLFLILLRFGSSSKDNSDALMKCTTLPFQNLSINSDMVDSVVRPESNHSNLEIGNPIIIKKLRR